MDEKELDALLDRALGPEPAPPALQRRLAGIPVEHPRRAGLLAGWLGGRGLAAGGLAAMAAAALLGFWLGSTSLAPVMELEEGELVTLAFGPDLGEMDLP
ncbi:hypothetical protein [Marinimicrococcus flavescens]|uniref:Uncharacterized protein n=1 Tax=Marinimicrococcus flavescens TaxID=3031815 RepID=A0AAP3UZS0_9PROT|nr:hypothetical protein [Marinimicrococcus flavescens]